MRPLNIDEGTTMFKNFRLTAALGALALSATFAAPNFAVAATANGTMAVSALVTDSCTTTATPVAFGTYAFGATSSGTSTISVVCTIGAAVASVGLDNGLQPAAGVRQMKSGALVATIPYGIYQDSGHATAWTLAAFPAATAYTALITPATFTAFALAPSGANVLAGTYSDTVGIVVTYT